ncbi:MAG: glutamine synthetase III [Clostridia bacterium]|nr:glutamine synthetase III [Clostridia bacterium]
MSIPEYFGCMVFNEACMKSRLPKEIYTAMKKTIRDGKSLDLNVANVVANAMKDWAVEHGATHYTHWFQPMTGITAEKHDSFISPFGDNGVIMEFSGKELVKGEPDASSFPSGGIRATFEARGYTAWDPTSYAFIKDDTLCIPTAFCSYGGEALDKKTPLLRSMEAINRQAMRVLRLFGNDDVTSVKTTVGAEQEYFLIDQDVYNRRKDLIYTGRTLFGARPPKGQELDDHYFGTIKPRVAAFMKELDRELWKLGVLSKTEHNEVAPSQHELAPVFTTTNIASDHNQLTMEVMKKVAARHHMVCLLHEKPFAGVNGSGKHNNWSISTNTGVNLLEPGETPYENAQFLLFLCAVIKGVDEYADLLRISVASAGNDHRLGAQEAPPAVVSMFLGDELSEILDAIEADTSYDAKEKSLMRVGVHVLPKFPKDTTDRNRTSPFAFTGNKFEFRMLGSADTIACANMMINTAVAEELRQFADYLESADDFHTALNQLIRKTIKEHKRIIFNGNGYDESWIEEATQVRGLPNLVSTPDALPHYTDEKNVTLFLRHKVLSEVEVCSRCEILLENYSKILHIEALTMIDMVNKDLLPAMSKYVSKLCKTISAKSAALPGVDSAYESNTARRLSELTNESFALVRQLETYASHAATIEDALQTAMYYKDTVLPCMEQLRKMIDEAESLTAKEYWPYPSYGDMLFSIK